MTRSLLHIGYHKTGTNWLQEQLFGDARTGYRWLGKQPLSHPVHTLVRARPLDFDPGAVRAAFEPLLADAERAELLPVVSFPRLSGHPYSGGYDSKLIADRLAEVFSEARVLIVVREQRSMIVSVYKQYVNAGGEAPLGRFLQPAKQREWRLPRFDYGHFAYDRLIAYYRSLFGADSVLVLPYEQLVRDGPSFVRAIGRFAGRELPEEVLGALPFHVRSNSAQTALGIAIARPLNRFRRSSDLNPAPLLESSLLTKAGRRIRRADLVGSRVTRGIAVQAERRLKDAVAAAVGDRYVASNNETVRMTGLDLGALGWRV
ncbi:MAG TPA: sulfotransferase domain-containing protein [Gaiellaceae bacterium]|nr:sulfotransferase domain-containing protein [Gaiellaceae bacterium]